MIWVIIKNVAQFSIQCLWRNMRWSSFCWISFTWWSHNMEALVALLAFCERSPAVIPLNGSVTRGFCVLFNVSLIVLNKQSGCWWFRTQWRSCEVTVMPYAYAYFHTHKWFFHSICPWWKQYQIICRVQLPHTSRLIIWEDRCRFLLSIWCSISGRHNSVRPSDYSGVDQRKHQSSTSLAFVCGEFPGDRWIPRTNGLLRGKCFRLMASSDDLSDNKLLPTQMSIRVPSVSGAVNLSGKVITHLHL